MVWIMDTLFCVRVRFFGDKIMFIILLLSLLLLLGNILLRQRGEQDVPVKLHVSRGLGVGSGLEAGVLTTGAAP